MWYIPRGLVIILSKKKNSKQCLYKSVNAENSMENES